MKSIIKEIFYGTKGHFDTIKPSEKYFELQKKGITLYDTIIKELSDEKIAELKKLCDLYCEIEIEVADTHFIEGVKLGILLAVEACD